MKRLVSFCFIFMFSALVYATRSQIDFVATVVEIVREDGDGAVLTMSVTSDVEVTVRVTADTDITDPDEDLITVLDLSVGMVLKVKGVFITAGILALEIDVKDAKPHFEIQGPIETIIGLSTIIVHGFMIVVDEAEIKGVPDKPLGFSDLMSGQLVKVKGNVIDGALVAFEVKVGVFKERPARVRFEGLVTAVGESDIMVLIEGDVSILVRITPETETKGDLAVGVLLGVIGTLADDLNVDARRIRVRRLLQLSPHKLKMRLNQTRRVEVILRETLDRAVDLDVSVVPTDLVELSPTTVMIPADRVTGSFEVTSGATVGEAVIRVAMPAELGGLAVTLKVEVEDKEERGEEELEIKWRPDEIRMATNGMRDVRLNLNQAAPPDGLIVRLALRDDSEGLVLFPEDVLIEGGSRGTVVKIETLSEFGEVKIRATLPEDADHDDLEVKIRGEKREEREKLEIHWEPDKIETSFDQTVTVRLVLDRPAAFEFVAILTLKGRSVRESEDSVRERERDIVEFPDQVRFPRDSTEATVEITTSADVAGKVKIQAALPFEQGGDKDDLEIEVK